MRTNGSWWAIVALVLMLAACGGGVGGASPSPTVPPGASSATPVADPTETPTPDPEPSAYQFLYRESGQEADIIWRVNPSDPSQRQQLAAVTHRPGWPIVASLSPDGKSVVYTVLPASAVNPAGQAEAYVLDLTTGETKLVAKAVDLNLRPLWSPDGQLIFLGGHERQDVLLIQLDLGRPMEDPERDKVIIRNNVATFLSFTPIGFSQEAEGKLLLYIVQVRGGTAGGTSIATYPPGPSFVVVATATAHAASTATATAAEAPPPEEPPPEAPPPEAPPPEAPPLEEPPPEAPPPEEPPPEPTPKPTPTPAPTFVVQISDQIARDCSLSPDAKRVVCLVPGLVDGQFVTRAFVADLPGRRVDPLPSEALAGGDHLRPLWHPGGDKVSVGQLPSAGNPGGVAVIALSGGEPLFLTPPSRGFDVPMSWAPDGRFLVVTSFLGDSLANPGPPGLAFLSPGGQRLPAAQGVEVEPVGWVKAEQ